MTRRGRAVIACFIALLIAPALVMTLPVQTPGALLLIVPVLVATMAL